MYKSWIVYDSGSISASTLPTRATQATHVAFPLFIRLLWLPLVILPHNQYRSFLPLCGMKINATHLKEKGECPLKEQFLASWFLRFLFYHAHVCDSCV